MSVGGLTAVLFAPEGPRVIDRIVSDVSFKSIDPGGFAGVNLTLSVPISRADLAYCHVGIFNAETGEQVAAGQIPDNGESPGYGQPVRQITAVGAGIGAMQNEKKPRIYVDTDQTAWVQAYGTSIQTTSWQYKDSPSGDTANSWVLNITSPTAPVNRRSDLRYHPLRSTDQLLASYSFWTKSGRASSNNRTRAYASNFDDTTYDITSDSSWSTSSNWAGASLGTDWSLASNRDNVFLSYLRQTSTLTVDRDLDWIELSLLSVMGTRLGRDGSILTDADTSYFGAVLTADVFVDLFARVPEIDALTAIIESDPSVGDHSQLAWREGATNYQIANEVVQNDPIYTWAVWGRQPNGLYEAEARIRSTEPRYELSVTDDFRPASDTGNSNKWLSEVWVTGKIDSGRLVARKVPASASYVRPDNAPFASATASINPFTNVEADRVGAEMIKESFTSANAAKARVSRKIKDNLTGRWIEPHMIRPGYLCRVRGARPESIDVLNPSMVADSCLYRIASVVYQHSAGAADLELNAYSLTESRAIASLSGSR